MTTSKQTNAELIDYKFKIMNEELKAHRAETKDELKSLHSKMDAFIEASQKMYVTKTEHEENRQAIKKLEETNRSIAVKVFVWLGTAFLWIVIWIWEVIAKKLNLF